MRKLLTFTLLSISLSAFSIQASTLITFKTLRSKNSGNSRAIDAG